MHLPETGCTSRIAAHRRHRPAPVLGHVQGVVARQEAEVQALVWRLRDAACARREEDPRRADLEELAGDHTRGSGAPPTTAEITSKVTP